MTKEVSITDLFKTRWEELTFKEMITIIDQSEIIFSHPKDSPEYGFAVINILRTLRKNKNLVSKAIATEAVALDCFNDITFFHRNTDGSFKTPWLFFPVGNFNSNDVSFERPEMQGTLPMYNRTFDHLVWGDKAFSGFCILNYNYQRETNPREKKNIEQEMSQAIDTLVAVLYHPQAGFEVDKMEVHARLVNLKLKTEERALILHTYVNIREFITRRLENLFPEERSDEIKTPVDTGPMWLTLRYELSETRTFSGFDTARHAPLWDALDLLEKKAYEANQRKENDKG